MGLVATIYQLAPTADSLKSSLPDRLRHSFFYIDDILACLCLKVKCLFAKEFWKMTGCFLYKLTNKRGFTMELRLQATKGM